MSEKSYISKEKLPLGQNYKELRAQGMDFIQKHSGTTWTNLNPSDPGVTFLDELCFALTELGYCTNFPMEDLLTDSDGNLALDDQFYLPENILTTSPITINDYRKYIIDKVKVVENVALSKNVTNGKTSYLALLKISTSIKTTEYNAICRDVQSTLERCRNLAIQIKSPAVLERTNFNISGSISLKHKDDLLPFLNDLIKASDDYIFPSVVPVPYYDIDNWEENVNTVFNGPYLDNGWISDEVIGSKKDTLFSFELVNVIRSLKQVKGVNKLAFGSSKEKAGTKITVKEAKLIEIDWITAVLSGDLEIYANGQLILVTEDMVALNVETNHEPKPAFAASFNSAESIQGSFRDVNTYYSIQETLPDVYRVGDNALKESDSEVTKAQVKQLKGYLTLFDQIMANQLSQLANLSTLFSFENVTVGLLQIFKSIFLVRANWKT